MIVHVRHMCGHVFGEAKKFIAEAAIMLRTSDTRLTEFLMANITLAWAAVMMLPAWTAPDSLVHQIMIQFMPQFAWNAVFLTVGLSGIYAVVFNDLRLRRMCAFASTGLFIYVAISFWKCPVLLPGALIIPVYVAASVLAYWRLGEAIRYEEMRRAVLATYVGPEAISDGPIRRRADGVNGRGVSTRD